VTRGLGGSLRTIPERNERAESGLWQGHAYCGLHVGSRALGTHSLRSGFPAMSTVWISRVRFATWSVRPVEPHSRRQWGAWSPLRRLSHGHGRVQIRGGLGRWGRPACRSAFCWAGSSKLLMLLSFLARPARRCCPRSHRALHPQLALKMPDAVRGAFSRFRRPRRPSPAGMVSTLCRESDEGLRRTRR
jgi:hypothetical protein